MRSPTIRRLHPSDTPLYQAYLLQRGAEAAEDFAPVELTLHQDAAWCRTQLERRQVIGHIHHALLGALTLETHLPKTDPPWLVHLANMYVLQSERRRGLGKELLRHATNEVKRSPYFRGLHLHVAQTNTPAIRLYEAMGFARYGLQELLTLPNGRNVVCDQMSLEFARDDQEN